MNQENVENGDQVVIGEIAAYLKSRALFVIRKWKLLLLFAVLFAGLGFVIAITRPITYTSTISFILEEGKAAPSGLSSIAGQLGFDIGGLNNSSLLAGDNIIGILKSRKMVESVLMSPYDKDSGKTIAAEYARLYRLDMKWEEKLGKGAFSFYGKKREEMTRVEDSLLQIISKQIINKELIVEKIDKKMSFIRVLTTMEGEELNARFANKLVQQTIDFYIKTRTQRQQANVDRLQKRADSIGRLLNITSYEAAAKQSTTLDVNPMYATTLVSSEISSRNKLMLGTIYAEVVKNLELQKITLTQETPVLQIIDTISFPLEMNKTSTLKSIIIAGILGVLFISIFLALFRYKEQVVANREPAVKIIRQTSEVN